MSNIWDMIVRFSEMINMRFVIATVVMMVIFFVICYLIFLIFQSIQKRSEAISVRFPSIDDYGEIEKEQQFEANKEFSVELVNPEDDVVDSNIEADDELFIETLSMETKELISDEDEEVSLDMPEVGEIDYEKIKRERESEMESIRLEREQANIDNLRKLAKADSEEDLEMPSQIDK